MRKTRLVDKGTGRELQPAGRKVRLVEKERKDRQVQKEAPSVAYQEMAMDADSYRLLELILKANDEQCFDILKKIFDNDRAIFGVDKFGATSYLYIPGYTTCLQSHVDTMIPAKQGIFLERNGNVVTNKFGVLGADDRAGVFTAIRTHHAIKSEGGKTPGLLFTNGEEQGGWGMLDFLEYIEDDAKLKEEVLRYRMFVALDRQGANEFVQYTWSHQAVKDHAKLFGWTEKMGSFSDCLYLSEELLTPHVNVSVGYHGQHTVNERLHLDELEMSIARCILMVKHPIARKYKIPADRAKDSKWGGYGAWYKDDWYGKDSKGDKKYIGMHGLSEDYGHVMDREISERLYESGGEWCELCYGDLNKQGYCMDCGHDGRALNSAR